MLCQGWGVTLLHLCFDLFNPSRALCTLPLAVSCHAGRRPVARAMHSGTFKAYLLLPRGYGIMPQIRFQSQAALGSSQPSQGSPSQVSFSREGKLLHRLLLQPTALGFSASPAFSWEVSFLPRSGCPQPPAIWPDPPFYIQV